MSAQKLVLVSNRIPITFTTEDGKLKGVPSSGGLVSALEPLLKDHGGIWVGSGGTEDSPQIRKILEKASGDNPYQVRTTLPDGGGAEQLLRRLLQ